MTKTIEERLSYLENREKHYEKLELELERCKAYAEIQNVMAMYEYRLNVGDGPGMYDLFAKDPDVQTEMMWGIYVGNDSIKRLFAVGHNIPDEKRKGFFNMHTLCTPLIEVAKDAKTAKALWISPGIETPPDKELKRKACWAWARYGCDFIKEDGEWKIWHMKLYGLFHCPYNQPNGWVDTWTHVSTDIRDVPDAFKPDKPTTFNWYYTSDSTTVNIPVPPVSYDTWDGKSVAIGPEKK